MQKSHRDTVCESVSDRHFEHFNCHLLLETTDFPDFLLHRWIQKKTCSLNPSCQGFTGHTGIYLSAAALQEARGSSGLPLEYYQIWDATWFAPGEYFTKLGLYY